MKSLIYRKVFAFKRRYSATVAFRLKAHCSVIDYHLNPGEEVLYAFCGQKNGKFSEIFSSCVIALTNKRIIIGQKRVLWGYFYTTITPDLFNDLSITAGLLWGKVIIDTVKEVITISNVDKQALDEIETAITAYMLEEKKKYGKVEKELKK